MCDGVRVMKEKIKDILLYAGMPREQFQTILKEGIEDNYRHLRIYSRIVILLLLFMSVLDLFVAHEMDSNQRYYWIAIGGVALIDGLTCFVKPTVHQKVDGLVYLFLMNLYIMGTGIMMQHTNYPTVVLMSVMILMPLLFILQPYKVMLITLAVGAFSLYNSAVIEKGSIAKIDIYYTICFTIIALIENYTSNHMRLQALMAHHKVKYLSEHDILTKLYNHNRYESKRDSYPLNATRLVTLIYIDANGLHEINNSLGHSAGDQLLITIAKVLQSCFRGDIYRIGGDEFVVVTLDQNDREITEQIERAQTALEETNYSASFGFVTMGKYEKSMKELEKEAEMLMYQKKKIYYQQSDHDRRRPRY